ncbi:hypothetical protein RFX30_19860, partial [Acinetobacter baumannii]|nr:hypothetical protein [Acinetobacter baumannii]
ESCYFKDNEVIINYTSEFVTSIDQLLDSQVFNEFLNRYIDYLNDHRRDLRDFLYQGTDDRKKVVLQLKNTFHLMLLMNIKKIDMP